MLASLNVTTAVEPEVTMTSARRSWSSDEKPMPMKLAGWLTDGTPRHAPVGELLAEGDWVCCHLCGHWYLSVASHLSAHGWTKHDYLEAFGLEWSNALAGPATRKRRAAALTARQVHETAIRQAQDGARARARNGDLTAAASMTARGRPHPAQRRTKTMAALAAVDPRARAEGSARYARGQLKLAAAEVAQRFGFSDFAEYVADRLATGMSLAAISREAGLHKDWLSRHLAVVAPALSGRRPRDQSTQRWLDAVAALGFDDLESYLRTRHLIEHRTIAFMAAETSLSPAAILAAMADHGIVPVAHAGKRTEAAERDRQIIGSAECETVADYLADCRARGVTWKQLSAQTGVPQASLRRRLAQRVGGGSVP